jgi:hypothetical protein
LHRWRIHIPGIPDTKGVTGDAKSTSDAKMSADLVVRRISRG